MNSKLIKRSFSLALFLLICVLGLACSKKQIDGDLHFVIWENPKSLDPSLASEANVTEALGSIYEPLYQYHYLKRPYELIPLLAEDMPRYSKDGLTVTIKIKKGIRFQDDPAFKDGKGREVTAHDFIFGFKRIADPKNASDGWWIFDEKIIGLNEWRDAQSGAAKSDYSQPVSGFSAPDSHTLVIKLKKKYPQLNYVLAMLFTAPVPQEAVQKYGAEFAQHPVGTGPYVLKEFTRGSQIVLEKNPNFHDEYFPEEIGTRMPADGDCDVAPPKEFTLDDGCKTGNVGATDFDYGKKLPLTDRVVIHIILEQQPIWLQFMKGALDWCRVPKDSFNQAIDGSRNLKPELANKGVKLSKYDSTTMWWLGFNMRDPLVGKNKNLRKAIGLAYDSKKDIELFTNNLSTPSNQLLPTSIAGFLPHLPPREYNIEKAKEYLAKAGYPGGKGLPAINYDLQSSSTNRQLGEYMKAQMEKIGVKINIRLNTRPELFDLRKKSKHQIIFDGWIADYPDAENYMQLLYGRNKSPGPNNSSYENPEFDKLYEQMAVMQPSSARQKIIEKMTKIALDDAVWIPNRIETLYMVHQGWLRNYVYNDFPGSNHFKYYRVDLDKKKQLLENF